MKGKIVLFLVMLALTLALTLQPASAQEESASDTAKIMNKLDEVLVNQAKIIQELKEIKQELEVIKIRATR